MGCKIFHYDMKPDGKHDFTPVVKHLKHEKKPVFAIFYMRGCGPCEAARPEWNKLREKQSHLPQHALLLEIDHELKHQLVDSLGEEYAEIRDISSFPTITLLKHGDKMKPYEGQRLVKDFQAWIHKHANQWQPTADRFGSKKRSWGGKRRRKTRRTRANKSAKRNR